MTLETLVLCMLFLIKTWRMAEIVLCAGGNMVLFLSYRTALISSIVAGAVTLPQVTVRWE